MEKNCISDCYFYLVSFEMHDFNSNQKERQAQNMRPVQNVLKKKLKRRNIREIN